MVSSMVASLSCASSGLTLAEAAELNIPREMWESWEPRGDGKRCPSAEWLARATSAVLNHRRGPLTVAQLRKLSNRLSQ